MLGGWNYGASDKIECYYQPHMSNKKLHEMFTKKEINPTYAFDYKQGFGFKMDTDEDIVFPCYDAGGIDWDGLLCDDANTASVADDTFYDYGCNTEIMENYYGTGNGCPVDYLCNTISGQNDVGCCYYNGNTIDTDDDRYIHHCTDNSGCTTGWYCDPTDGVCHNLVQITCTLNGDCAVGQTCNTTSSLCIPGNERDCATDVNCALDEYCDISGYCIHADCHTNAKC